MTWDQQTLERRTALIETYAGRKRSNLNRYVARSKRVADWREWHGTRRPRSDQEILVAWLLRKLRREEPDAFPVGRYEPKFDYVPDPRGPGATWYVSIRCLIAKTDYEREYFPKIDRLPKDMHTFAYMEVTGDPHTTYR